MTQTIPPIPIGAIEGAAARLDGLALRTPLVRLAADGDPPVWLKLENLQPVGSFKIRGAGNAMALVEDGRLAGGVYTASAGNMAQGVAWCARSAGVPCTVIVPDDAPATKLAAIRRLGARIVAVPFAEWWTVLQQHSYPGMEGRFIHPVCDPGVIAGNGTIGLEILEDLPDLESVVVPFGGGGLACGIASAIRARRPEVKIYAAEVATAAPLAASLAAARPVAIEREATFVDGIGGSSVLEPMWGLITELLEGSLVAPLHRVVDAVRLLAERNRVVAEGAGATAVASALDADRPLGATVCVISGGNLDSRALARILSGGKP